MIGSDQQIPIDDKTVYIMARGQPMAELDTETLRLAKKDELKRAIEEVVGRRGDGGWTRWFITLVLTLATLGSGIIYSYATLSAGQVANSRAIEMLQQKGSDPVQSMTTQIGLLKQYNDMMGDWLKRVEVKIDKLDEKLQVHTTGTKP